MLVWRGSGGAGMLELACVSATMRRRGGNRITGGVDWNGPAGEDDGWGGEATVTLTCGAHVLVGPDVSGVLVGTGDGPGSLIGGQ